jgi:hypothetical protein
MTAKTDRNKVHQRYYSKTGTLLPGVTTVLGLLAKPALIHWSWSLGMKGIDYRKARDEAADIGSIAHYLILTDLKNIKPNLSDYAQVDIDKAYNAMKSYYAWRKMNDVQPIEVECSLISEKWGYGGTFDLLAKVNGVDTLIDFKTSNSLYSEYSTQIGAYYELIRENRNIKVVGKLIRINKANNDDFEVKTVEQIEKQFELFKYLLRVYNLQKELY